MADKEMAGGEAEGRVVRGSQEGSEPLGLTAAI